MSTLQLFMDDINKRVPNAFTDAEKIVWINEAISEMYREIAIQDIAEVPTVAKQVLYALPAGVIFDNILSITISMDIEDDKHTSSQRILMPIALNESIRNYCWIKSDETHYGIYPIPYLTGQIIRIYYQVQPPVYTSADLALDLEAYLRKDYIQAVKYHTLYIICESMEEIAKANNYQARYNAQLIRAKADKYRKQGKYPSTRDVMKASSRLHSTRYSVRRKNKAFPYYPF